MKILMIDVGGTNVKIMLSGGRTMRKFRSGPKLTARGMVRGVKALAHDWQYDAITLGFPGLVEDGKLAREPLNLNGGWMRFDFEKAFGKPVRIINDAALQALANYKGGRMLFVGLGTSVGCALVADGAVIPLELGLIPLGRRGSFMSRLSKEARRRDGQKRWQKAVEKAVELLADAFWPRDFVIGGGNAKHLDPLPKGCRRTSNKEAVRGATRLWKGADMLATAHGTTWRVEKAGKKPLRKRPPKPRPLPSGKPKGRQ